MHKNYFTSPIASSANFSLYGFSSDIGESLIVFLYIADFLFDYWDFLANVALLMLLPGKFGMFCLRISSVIDTY
jgi:hypothetical protein